MCDPSLRLSLHLSFYEGNDCSSMTLQHRQAVERLGLDSLIESHWCALTLSHGLELKMRILRMVAASFRDDVLMANNVANELTLLNCWFILLKISALLRRHDSPLVRGNPALCFASPPCSADSTYRLWPQVEPCVALEQTFALCPLEIYTIVKWCHSYMGELSEDRYNSCLVAWFIIQTWKQMPQFCS